MSRSVAQRARRAVRINLPPRELTTPNIVQCGFVRGRTFPRVDESVRVPATLVEASRSGVQLDLDDRYNLSPAAVVRVDIEVDGRSVVFFGQVQWRAASSTATRSSWGIKCLVSPARGHRSLEALIMERLRASGSACARERDARAPLLSEREDQFVRSACALDPTFERAYDAFLDSLANDGDLAVMWTNALESPLLRVEALLARWRLLADMATEVDESALDALRRELDASCREVLRGPLVNRALSTRCARFMDLRVFCRLHAPRMSPEELARSLDGWRALPRTASLRLRGALAGRNGTCFLTPDLGSLPADEDECALTLLRLGVPEHWMNVLSGCVGVIVDSPGRLRKPAGDDGLNGLFRPELGCGPYGYARNLHRGAPALRELVCDPVPVVRISALRVYWKARAR